MCGNTVSYLVSTLNRWLTRHGEGLSNILVSSVIVISLWTIMYPFAGGIQGSGGNTYNLELCLCLGPRVLEILNNSLYFSLASFSALGSSTYTPATLLTRYLATFQSLLGTLLIALFVFTLGRRVNR